MKRLLLNLVLTAAAFAFVLPLIPGIDFHGNVMAALLLSLVFGVMVWVVDLVAVALSAIITVGTLGLALLWLIPLWILGFWLLPAVALKLVADLLPAYLTVSGWLPAVLGGVVMLAIGTLTNKSWSSARPA